jgi:hypothetical protein
MTWETSCPHERRPGRGVSRGPGRWQRELIRAVDGTVVASVAGVVRTTVLTPDRNDFTAARRGAKQLALAQRVAALYVWCCPRCNEVQDRADPQPCCGTVRSMLAVARLERRKLLVHPAPSPGGVAPSWINVAVPSRPPGQLAVPSFEDFADLVVRRCYEGLQSGRPTVSLQGAAAVMRLAWQIERDEAIPARDDALAELTEAQGAVLALRTAIIRRSGQDEWQALWGEVLEERDRAREIRKARQRFATMARPPR